MSSPQPRCRVGSAWTLSVFQKGPTWTGMPVLPCSHELAVHVQESELREQAVPSNILRMNRSWIQWSLSKLASNWKQQRKRKRNTQQHKTKHTRASEPTEKKNNTSTYNQPVTAAKWTGRVKLRLLLLSVLLLRLKAPRHSKNSNFGSFFLNHCYKYDTTVLWGFSWSQHLFG